MTTAEKPTRAYHSTLREQQAERTRQLVATAARTAFLERGWSGTSVRAVAQAAGVSQATVFNIYGSKAGLATSLIDAIDGPADIPRLLGEIEAGAGDPPAQLRAIVAFDRRLFEGARDVIAVMLEGRREHPELGDAYLEGRDRGDTNRRRLFGSWPASAWRDGVTLDQALDVYATLCSAGTYGVAVDERGWSPQQVEEWWYATLAELLLA